MRRHYHAGEMKRLRIVLLGALALLILSAAPAFAHAQLERTTPPSGAVLDEPPASVVLEFTEPVEVAFGAVRVWNAEGKRLETGRARHAAARRDAVVVDLPDLPRGSYVVTWRVVSSDAHPIHGAFTFRVGSAPEGNTQSMVRELLAADGASPTVGALYGLARFAAFVALILLVGGIGFVVALWPDGAGDRLVRRIIAGAWIGCVVTAVAAIALHGVYVAALPLGHIVKWSVVDQVISTRFGQAWSARLVVLVVAGFLLVRFRNRPGALGTRLGAAAVGIGLLVTPGLAGHPGAEHPVWLGLGLDATHLGAVSLWLGGLAMLTMVVLRRAATDALGDVVARFSRLALGAVAVILGTGILQSWRQARSLDAVSGTTYGRLVLVKLGLFALMVTLAAVSRSWVRHRTHAGGVGGAPQLNRLRRAVGGEAAIGLAVLAVTALLVNAPPARTALAQPFSTEFVTPQLLIEVTVDPAKTGPVDVHLYTLTRSGQVTDVVEMTATLSLPDKSIGPLRVPVTRAGPGHFSAYGFDVPLRGRWTLEITARTTDIDQTRATTSLRIR